MLPIPKITCSAKLTLRPKRSLPSPVSVSKRSTPGRDSTKLKSPVIFPSELVVRVGDSIVIVNEDDYDIEGHLDSILDALGSWPDADGD